MWCMYTYYLCEAVELQLILRRLALPPLTGDRYGRLQEPSMRAKHMAPEAMLKQNMPTSEFCTHCFLSKCLKKIGMQNYGPDIEENIQIIDDFCWPCTYAAQQNGQIVA